MCFLSLLPMLLSIQCLVLLLAYKLFPFDYITSGLLARKRCRLGFRAASPRAIGTPVQGQINARARPKPAGMITRSVGADLTAMRHVE